MKSNFEFKGQCRTTVEEIGKMVVVCLSADSIKFSYQIGMYEERVVKEIVAVIQQLPLPQNDDTQVGRILIAVAGTVKCCGESTLIEIQKAQMEA